MLATKPYIFDVSENDGLPLEYKLRQLRARWEVDASYFVNKPLFESESSVLGLGFEEEILDVGHRQLRPFIDD